MCEELSTYRGDTFKFNIEASFSDNNEKYVFSTGDKVVVGLKTDTSQKEYSVRKEFEIAEETEQIIVTFTNNDTKELFEHTYKLEAELRMQNGTVCTLFQRNLSVKGDVVNE